jgi:hypothetical protein
VSLKKKAMSVHPLAAFTPPLVVAGGTDIGTIMAFVGGWFEFKRGYLNGFTAIYKGPIGVETNPHILSWKSLLVLETQEW